MGLFVGEFEQLVDAKHRMAIPLALRECAIPEVDGEDFYLIVGPGKRLWLYPKLAFERLHATLNRGPLPDRQSGKTNLLYAMGRVVKPDKQGRIVIPESSMKRVGLEANQTVTLVGSFDHIEIWPSAAWERNVDENLPTYTDMIYDAAELAKQQAAVP
jgi:division/cell wall cluster transcriptional repressor MraZ